LEDYLKVNSVTAGFITSLTLICGLVSAPIFGKIYDKIRNIKKLLFICGIAMSAGLACNAVTGTSPAAEYIVLMSNIMVGVFSAGVFTIAYASAKESRVEMKNKENIKTMLKKRSKINRGQYSYETLGISWVNGLSLFGAFWVPIIFSFVVHHIGYTFAWLLGGLFSFLFILPSLGIAVYKVH
jgi:MFS family permease